MDALAARKAAIEKMVEDMKGKQAELRKAGAGVNQLQQQLQENVLVKEELGRVADGANVYKLVGPVLIPQDLAEAKSAVDSRIAHITALVKSAGDNVKKVEQQNNDAQVAILKEQEAFQAMVRKAAEADPSLVRSR